MVLDKHYERKKICAIRFVMSRVPLKIRWQVWQRCKGICEARLLGCKFRASELHHVKMLSRRGSHDPKNLLYICGYCHNQITLNKPGTERFRTHRWQEEGEHE